MLTLLDPDDPRQPFPPVHRAERQPNGLLAVGGDLSPERLLNAYRSGIFPWFSADQPILWWSPNPRTVLFPERMAPNRSLRKAMRNRGLRVSMDQCFRQVMEGCAAPRAGADGTWITDEMRAAYLQLHRLGHAHSVEVWQGEELVGGLYGIGIGRIFFGESMFTRVRDASKVGFAHLVERLRRAHYRLIDCQVYTGHLVSLGAEEIPRNRFIELLRIGCEEPGIVDDWARPPLPPHIPGTGEATP